MRLATQASTRNQMLALMSETSFARIAPRLEPAELPRGTVIVERGAEIETVVFPESGVASIVIKSEEGLAAEVGLFGRDGFGPASVVLHETLATEQLIMQVEGHGWRLAREDLLQAMQEDAALRAQLLRFVHALNVQTSCTALSNAVHTVNERLARWILMCDDRIGGRMAITHEFLSVMLGVRRATVTDALHVLEGSGFIRSERNCLSVRDRAAMQDFARDAYGQAERVYANAFGAPPGDVAKAA